MAITVNDVSGSPRTGKFQTEVRFTSNNDAAGYIVIVGNQSGAPNRQCIISAEPHPGYKFERWEVTNNRGPREGIIPSYIEIYPTPFASIDDVCRGDKGVLGGWFYSTDGRTMYIDDQGTILAPDGFWFAGASTYYATTTGVLSGPFACGTSSPN